MKQTNWQRLATIGLCSSLMINAFSGVTAVAETVTIESSPTAESVKEESTPASTEASEATTDTSQEATEETTKETEEQKEPTETSEVKTENSEPTPANVGENELQKGISPRWVPNGQVIYPRMTFAFTDETGKAFADENLTLSGLYLKLVRQTATDQWRPYGTDTGHPIVSSNIGNGQYRVAVNEAVPFPYNFFKDLPTGYNMKIYAVEHLKIDNTLKYVDSIVAFPDSMSLTKYSAQQIMDTAQFGNYGYESLSQRDSLFSKNSTSIFSLKTVVATDIGGVLRLMRVASVGSNEPVLYGFDGTPTYRQTMRYKVTRKQVTEKFVNTSGAAITPPSGFTQNKKTPMTSNAFTFKQSGTLPVSYTADGKAYKFKGWYKGKTKPATLNTTKTPSYAVTYDGNDDLNVVYEEVGQDTWIYPGFYAEFVDENGQAFNEPLTFSGNYTQFLRKNEDNTIGRVGTPTPIVGTKDTSKNNRYKIGTQSRVAMPANFDTQISDIYGLRGYTIDDITITNTLNYVDKIEATNTEIPVASYPIGYVGVNPVFNNGEPTFLNAVDKAFKKGTDNKFAMKTTFGAGSSNATYPRLLRVATSENPPEKQMVLIGFDGTSAYKQTMNYKVTRKQVTEKFVNTSGTAITPPSGFSQNKQTPMTSNAFTFKQSGTLPDTYTAAGKTYKFKGWYKGKTKPATLQTTKAPSYAVTYDGNDDLNVVYEEANFPAVTYRFGFVSEAGQFVNPADIKITYDYKSYKSNLFSTIATNQQAINSGNLKHVTMPATYIPYPTTVSNTSANGEVLSNFSITIPKYYQSLSLYDKTGKINPTYPLPKMIDVSSTLGNTNVSEQITINRLMLTQRANKSYVPFESSMNFDPNVRFPVIFGRQSTNSTVSKSRDYLTLDNTVYYHLTNRRVTENFVDANGAKITAPSGFTQGKQTVINSDPYTFKQSGTLPDSYKIGTKTYQFKGWYKGKTKPTTLTTTKAPSYAVTYDDNDDLNVVYEESNEKTTTIPAVTYKFGFVDEKGTLIAPTNFNMTTNLTTVMNGTPKQVGTAGGVNNGNLKQLTMPSQQLTYTPSTPPVNPAFSGSTNFRLTVPKQYKLPTVTPGTYYTGSSTAYPIATTRFRYVGGALPDSRLGTDGKEYALFATNTAHSYQMFRNYWIPDTTKTYFSGVLSRADAEGDSPAYYTTDDTMYYFLENRRVTENFVDTSGAKITAPSGFTQGKKTVITSDAYTFKQSGTLPDSYKIGTKTYKFKGWYKGKTKPATLTTTKAPSYAVTYDDNDDLNVVYEEETVTTFYPSINLNFVNEKGGAFTPALTFSGKYNVQRASDNVITNLYDVTSKSNGNGQYTVSINNGSVPLSQELFKEYANGKSPIGTNALSFKLDKLAIDQQLKYVDSIQVEAAQSIGLNVYRYEYTSGSSTIIDSSKAPTTSNLPTADINGLNFTTDGTNFSNTNNRFLGMRVGHSVSSTGSYLFFTDLFSNNPTNDAKLVYKVTRKQVTENFVDAKGAKITAPTGFTQGNQVPMTSNTFKYTAAKALPATYTTGGKTYTFQGWYKGKTKPTALAKTTTPTFAATFDGNDDMTAVYKEETPTADVSMKGAVTVIPSGGNQLWYVTIANTGKAPLSNVKLKPTANFATGLARPTQAAIKIGTTSKIEPITASSWTTGVAIPDIPVGQSALVTLATVATGQPQELLQAEVLVSGNFTSQTTSATVRIQGSDQTITEPTGEGFISVPNFDFGQVGISGSRQQHGLKKAANYYGNGTRNPFVRIKKTQPNWSLTAQLSQPKSAKDSLPTATRLLLGQAPVASFSNYNLPTELKNPVGTTSAISLNANDTATSIIANQQFTGSDIYQLDFVFNNVKLEVPANQGLKGQQYTANVTWNLVTGP